MPPRRLALASLLLLSALPLWAQLPRGGDLGRRWKAKEWNGQFRLEGTWVRRGDTNEFNVEYRSADGRQSLYWFVTVLSVEGSEVRLRVQVTVQGDRRTYEFPATLLSDGRTIRGRGAWCKPAQPYCGFEAVADWSVAAPTYKQFARPLPPMQAGGKTPQPAPGANPNLPQLKVLPPRWRVKDNAIPGFPYQGTWTIQGKEVRFLYTTPSRALGTMSLDLWDGTMIVIRNRGTRRVYEGLLQPGGALLRGTARPCPPDTACTWEAVLDK